jgi:hypothetical protein
LTITCKYIIDRFKKGPADYKTIISKNVANWTDPDFPSNKIDGLYWKSPHTNGKLAHLKSYPWTRLTTMFPTYKIQGSEGYMNDIGQGSLGDCYFLAGINSVAKDEQFFDSTIIIKNITKPAIFAFKVFVRGIPVVVTIDDWVPVYSMAYKMLLFASPGWDGSLIGPLYEKVWAKINGNFENIEGGAPYDAVKLLTNAPSVYVPFKGLNSSAIWDLIKDGFSKGFIMSVGTPGSSDKSVNELNLPLNHAYTLVR